MSWMSIVVLLWLAALAIQLGLAASQWRQVRRVRRDSVPLDDAAVRARCDDKARQVGLRRAPALRVAEGIASPHVVGPWQPTILLPPSGQLSAIELDLALDHELAHLRRGDLSLGWVPALAQRLFFFHPLCAGPCMSTPSRAKKSAMPRCCIATTPQRTPMAACCCALACSRRYAPDRAPPRPPSGISSGD